MSAGTDVAAVPNLWQHDRPYFTTDRTDPNRAYAVYTGQEDPDGVTVYVYEGDRVIEAHVTTPDEGEKLVPLTHAQACAMLSRCADLAAAEHGEGSVEYLAAATAYNHALSDLETGSSIAAWPIPHALVDAVLTRWANDGRSIRTEWPEF